VEALAHALERAIADEGLRAELIRRGAARAARFRWADAARQLLDLYRGLARPR
jgi:glycosyltransferase involved in cell wall biosynthesis